MIFAGDSLRTIRLLPFHAKLPLNVMTEPNFRGLGPAHPADVAAVAAVAGDLDLLDVFEGILSSQPERVCQLRSQNDPTGVIQGNQSTLCDVDPNLPESPILSKHQRYQSNSCTGCLTPLLTTRTHLTRCLATLNPDFLVFHHW